MWQLRQDTGNPFIFGPKVKDPKYCCVFGGMKGFYCWFNQSETPHAKPILWLHQDSLWSLWKKIRSTLDLSSKAWDQPGKGGDEEALPTEAGA